MYIYFLDKKICSDLFCMSGSYHEKQNSNLPIVRTCYRKFSVILLLNSVEVLLYISKTEFAVARRTH